MLRVRAHTVHAMPRSFRAPRTTAPSRRCRRPLIALAALTVTLVWSANTLHAAPVNSLLLLVDTSGSMGDPIGSGNPEIKMDAAKAAALAAIDRALATSATEVAVLGFSGDCTSPISERLDFTTDIDRLTHFIDGLQAGGGTPMADALRVANRFMADSRDPRARSQMIVLLADGDNDCGDVATAMAELNNAGIVFRHETVGFGITPTSDAARDLRHVATTSGGQYHHAASATQLADVFMEFVDTFTVIDMLGMFGAGAGQGAQPSAPAGTVATGSAPQAADTGKVTDMIGMFSADEKSVGALAIDADQGTEWGWAAGYAAVADARQHALDECGAGCRIVATFDEGCAAYAADQTRGSTVSALATGLDTALQAENAAIAECRRRGGEDCIARVWACVDRFGGGNAGSDAGAAGLFGADGAADAAMEPAWGAIAVHPDEANWGWAEEHSTEAEAKAVALEACGDGCRIEMTFEGGCAAYAADETPRSTAGGWAGEFDTRSDAERAALEECEKGGGENCVVQVWHCGP